ncbi:vWA domain-containing protein [Falsiroseomonas ponticola]|uniref:vWA domain-containing protein n=1 Tax=Falsiroseomonas ponticola TaxID=2786951 RepID=UPI0019332221|nr:vWA domain-containing protein [Roseomonas ponticola]
MLACDLNRPFQAMEGEEVRYLRLRITPNAGGQTLGRPLPLDVALALDASSSMIGAPFDQARLAATRLAELLRPGDRLSLALFHGAVVELVRGLNGASAQREAASRLAVATTGFGTRIDLALDWLAAAATPVPGRARLAVLVTDGHPYDAARKPMVDLAPLHSRAAALGRAGVPLQAIGLGRPELFNAPLLHALCRVGGGGRFIHARTTDALTPELLDVLEPAQSVRDADARLVVEPHLPGLQLEAAARIAPSFAPLPIAPGQSRGPVVAVGEVGGVTELMLRLRVPGPGEGAQPGQRPLLSLHLNVAGSQASLAVPITFTLSLDRVMTVQESVERAAADWRFQDQAALLISSQDPGRTGEIARAMLREATRSGSIALVNAARQLQADLGTGANPAVSTSRLLDEAGRRRIAEGKPA